MKISKAKFTTHFDVIIVGAGAAGLFCAIQAAKRGRSVLILEHQKKLGSKILISGGGRCNFTNLGVKAECYTSKNPHFVKSALARFTPQDFIQLVEEYGIEYYEKTLGQLFCKNSARDILQMLESECEKYGVKIELGVEIQRVSLSSREEAKPHGEIQWMQMESARSLTSFEMTTASCNSLVIATGGLSLSKIGATDFGYKIAKQFGLKIIETKPALDGFVLKDSELQELSGISLNVILTVGKKSFRENILITHAGLSGPAALQGSLYWERGEEIEINLLPDENLKELLFKERKNKNKQQLDNFISQFFAKRFVDYFLQRHPREGRNLGHKSLLLLSTDEIEFLHDCFHHWKLKPQSTVGYSKAEVTKGGVSTDELSSKTMECKKVPGLYFIGEVVDVTGWLGGYNFHWAWASAWVAAQEL